MRKVMIGSPCYSGQIDVWYVNSLANTIKLSYERGVEVTPIWISFDALIQRARNDTLQLALEGDYDDLIWIDTDIEWQPEWFFKLLDYPVDVVGGTYRKKGDREEYVVKAPGKPDPETGLVEVQGLGTGFLRMSKTAIQHLWDVSESYIDKKDNKERRMAFDVSLVNGDLVSEDIHALKTLVDGGFKVWLDPTMTCNHTGPYKFMGDYANWISRGAPPNVFTAPKVIATEPKPRPQIPRAHRQL
jgi:hypothetical protein